MLLYTQHAACTYINSTDEHAVIPSLSLSYSLVRTCVHEIVKSSVICGILLQLNLSNFLRSLGPTFCPIRRFATERLHVVLKQVNVSQRTWDPLPVLTCNEHAAR